MDPGHDNTIAIRLASDKMEAYLVMREGLEDPSSSIEAIMSLVSAMSIKKSSEVTAAIHKAVELYDTHDFTQNSEFQTTIAHGTPPVHGRGGKFILDSVIERRIEEIKAKGSSDDERLDHRAQSAYIIVERGQQIGKLLPPTDGISGINVCGDKIPAKPGTSSNFKFESQQIEQMSNGALIARVPGQLLLTLNSARISTTLNVSNAVDFSTGHIDFPGDVHVAEGVRDGFEVRADLSISVNKLVEAANLIAGRSIKLRTGISGRDKGSITCGTDLTSKYLDGCRVRVGRDLMVVNDINDCEVMVSGCVRSPRATLLGNSLASLGDCELGTVGSSSGKRCILTLGRLPEMEQLIRDAIDAFELTREQVKKCQTKINELNKDISGSSSKAELLTRLELDLASKTSKFEPLLEAMKEAVSTMETSPTLTVQEMLYQGAEIRMNGLAAKIKQDIEGPIEISLNEEGEFICRDVKSKTSMPLSGLAEITPASGSYRLQDLPESLREAA